LTNILPHVILQWEEGEEGLIRPGHRSPRAIKKLLDWMTRCEREGNLRALKRAKGVLWYLRGKPPEEIARLLRVGLKSVYRWLARYRERGLRGLYEGTHPGRPSLLRRGECERLGEILEAGPYAYGFRRGVWSCPLVQEVIQREFGVHYHRDHVRKILHRLGFSFEGLGKKVAPRDKESHPRWIRKKRHGVKRRR